MHSIVLGREARIHNQKGVKAYMNNDMMPQYPDGGYGASSDFGNGGNEFDGGGFA